jgi:SM-20-related protein
VSADANFSAGANLSAAGISIRDEFIAPSQIQALLECARARRTRGEFAAARIGKQATLQRREDIRGDLTCWLSEPLYPAERILLEQFDALRLDLNRETFLGLFDLEVHYAWYPPAARYARHVDQPHGTVQRKVSLVLYLNQGWHDEDGGALRLYGAGQPPCDVAPLGGHLVCFLTSGREHEVLAARRDRWSISGWYRARD